MKEGSDFAVGALLDCAIGAGVLFEFASPISACPAGCQLRELKRTSATMSETISTLKILFILLTRKLRDPQIGRLTQGSDRSAVLIVKGDPKHP
jgi:hypothetical protein